MTRDDLHEAFRRAALEALDRTAWQVFRRHVTMTSPGATDADLPHIFPAIERQADRLAERFNFPIDD